jgi:hypothetical protein
MSATLAPFYETYSDGNNGVAAPDDARSAIPTYTPRAEITFPAFAGLSQSPPPREEEVSLEPLSPPAESGTGLSGLMGLFGGGQQQQQQTEDNNETGDKFGFGSTPFISNKDSDNVFDSIGNIFEDGGDTSDWIDVGYNVARYFGGFAEGGLVEEEPMAFAEGGLVPLAGGGKIAVGPGGGLDDLIPTSIEGRRAAALSDGEFVIPADVVSMMGDGSSNAGARRLYDLVRQVRDTKTGTTRQAGPLPVGDILKRSMS